MADPEEVFAELSRVCQSLARSVDTRYLPPELLDLPIRDIHIFQRAVDYLRQPLSPTRIRRYGDDPAFLQHILGDFVERLDQVRADQELDRITSQVPFRMIGPKSHRSAEPVLHEGLLFGDLNISEALRLLSDTVDSIPLDSLLSEDPPQTTGGVQALSRILPDAQLPAPAQFEIRDGRLSIVSQVAAPDREDMQNVQSAKSELLEDGQKIIDELSRSNCDRRIIEEFGELQARVASDEDIIRTGITNITCSHIFDQFKDELPDALYGMMKGHAVGVSMYVAQFPEWRRFADQAAAANLDTQHAPLVSAAARKIADEVANKPNIADPEVPRLLRVLAELTSDPERSSKRAIFAVLRTVENLVSSTYSYAKDLLKKTADKTVDSLSSTASKVIAAAVAGAIVLGPVASALPESAWVQKATEIIIAELRRAGVNVSPPSP